MSHLKGERTQSWGAFGRQGFKESIRLLVSLVHPRIRASRRLYVRVDVCADVDERAETSAIRMMGDTERRLARANSQKVKDRR